MRQPNKRTVALLASLCVAMMVMAVPSTAESGDQQEKGSYEKEIDRVKEQAKASEEPGVMSPANDDFADSLTVGTLPYSDMRSTSGATTESGEPTNYPGGTCASWSVTVGATAWYDYTPGSDATVSIDTFGSDYDTFLAVHTGSSVDSLSLVSCNDDSGSLQSKVMLDAVGGTTYRIQVGGYGGAAGNLDLDVSVPTATTNDDFDDSITVPSVPYSTSQSTDGTTTESGEPTSYSAGTCADWSVDVGGTVWYDYTPASDTSLVIDTFGSGYDTFLAVHTGSSVDSLSLVTCNDDSGSFQSQVVFAADAGTTYRIQIGGYGGSTGELSLNIDEFTPPANDHRADAFAIGALPYSNTQNTFGASDGPGEPTFYPAPQCATWDVTVGATVWYSYTPSLPGPAIVDTFGSNYDTVLAAFIEVNGQLVNIACNDDAAGFQSQVQFLALPGVTVYIQVGGWFGDTGDLVLNAS